jgi:uncharacterized protein
MAFSMYDASVPICAQQLGALIIIIDKAAAHCAANKIEESALLTDRLFPDMYCLARQFRQATDFGRATARKRVVDSLAFVNTLTRAQIEGTEEKVITWGPAATPRKMTGANYLQQFALPNFFFFVTTAYNILRHRAVPLAKPDFMGPVNWL